MDPLDDKADAFRRKLDEQARAHRQRLEADLQRLRQRGSPSATPGDASLGTAHWARPEAPSPGTPTAAGAQGLLHLTGIDWLHELDRLFAETFHLARYAEPAQLAYPTVYCESLEEFFTPLVRQFDLSEQSRRQLLAAMVTEAREQAERTRGGLFGYNLPGVGCYLNGWLLAYGHGVSPRAALDHPEIRLRIIATAVHEKLGHGFLEVYSTLGRVKSRLGATLYEIASRFGLRPADRALDKLRYEQTRLLFGVSQLLEEGWATWVEGFLPALWQGQRRDPKYHLETVIATVKGLPRGLKDRQQVQSQLLTALTWLFGPEPLAPEQALQAVRFVTSVPSEVGAHMGAALGQPLRYVLGELLFWQAERHVGPYALPYLALIAANVDPQPEQIGLNDLRDLLWGRPDLNPDARLALLSRLKLENPNDVAELARRAEAELSLTVPPNLKSSPKKEDS